MLKPIVKECDLRAQLLNRCKTGTVSLSAHNNGGLGDPPGHQERFIAANRGIVEKERGPIRHNERRVGFPAAVSTAQDGNPVPQFHQP
jgi:hypothetical protein